MDVIPSIDTGALHLPTADSVSPPHVPTLSGEVLHRRLDNGLHIALNHNPQAPVVTSAVWYRAGTRDERPNEGGIAHFLEHMMFKGSPGFGPGVVDRRTQADGGVNNAFTSHDATAYYFSFANDRWPLALEIEADRMAALTLDGAETDSERKVVLEEIAMYEDEPWDALEMRVQALLFGSHPYGRPVLGTRESLEGIGPDELASFHRRFYRPGNAVLVVAGDLKEGAERAAERVAEAFDPVPSGLISEGLISEGMTSKDPATDGRVREMPPSPPPLDGWQRLERRRGEVPRLLLSTRVPGVLAETDGTLRKQHAALRLATTLLGSGRASRLQRELVDEGQLCPWVSVHLTEGAQLATFSISLEVLPGITPAAAEERLFASLRELADTPPSAVEMERARRVLLADWVFANERIHQQAMTLGFDLTLFQEGHGASVVEAALQVTPEALSDALSPVVDPHRGGVVGWSLPED